MVAADDSIKALTKFLADGMNIGNGEDEGVKSPGPALATILESTEPSEESSATDYILEEYMFSDGETVHADDEEFVSWRRPDSTRIEPRQND